MFTLGCTPSSVSFLPAEPQKPRCRRNAAQSLGFQVASGNWVRKKKACLKPPKVVVSFRTVFLCPTLTRWLLPCCQTAPGGRTARSTLCGRRPGDSASGGSSRSGERNVDQRDLNDLKVARKASTIIKRVLEMTTPQIHLVEVPHSEGQSPPWRIVRFPFAVSVACDVQVHSKLNVFLKLKQRSLVIKALY